MDEGNKAPNTVGLGAAMAMGLGVGVAIGVAFENLAVGIGVGVAIGTAMAAAFGSLQRGEHAEAPVAPSMGNRPLLIGLVLVGLAVLGFLLFLVWYGL